MNESERQNARVPIAISIVAPKRRASTDERGAICRHLSPPVDCRRSAERWGRGAGAHFLAGQLASPQTATHPRCHKPMPRVSCIHALTITQPRAMGNANTSLVTQASASTCCLVVEPQSAFPRGNRGINSTKPQGLAIDDLLWSEVVQEIDPLARRLNAGFCTALLLYITIIGVFVGLGASGVIKQYNDERPSMF